MTYIDLINNFWRLHGSQDFGSNEIALYFYLLNLCNRQGWPNPLVYPNSKVCLGLGMSESTLIRSRSTLKKRGVLDFNSGKNSRKAPSYYFKFESSNDSRDDSSNDSRDDSRNDSRNGSRNGSRNDSRNDSIYKTIRQEDNKTISVVDGARGENVRFMEKFFDRDNLPRLQQAVAELQRANPATQSVDDFRRLADAVVAEWELTGKTHTGFGDWARHLLDQVRIKNRAEARLSSRGVSSNQPKSNPFDEYRRKLGGV